MKRFFLTWGFAESCLVLCIFVLLFYIEEDWRGPHVWAATKAKWEAEGESFDPNTYYPKPVPDDQNLAALPIFDQEPDPTTSGALEPLKLKDALDENKHGGEFPRFDKSLDEIRTKLAAAFAKAFPGQTPPADPLAQFESLYPLIPELRAAAATRPYCRLNLDYSKASPFRELGLLTIPIKLCQRLTLHAAIAMDENQPQVAMDDIRLNLRLAAGVSQDPTLVAGLVDIGVVAITRGLADDLMQRHAFTDAQLVELQHEFAKIDFLSQYKSTMRGEIVTSTIPMSELLKRTAIRYYAGLSLYGIFPGGWLDLDKSHTVDFLFSDLSCINPVSRRADPVVNLQIKQKIDQMDVGLLRYAPWIFLTRISVGPLINATRQFAIAQSHLDQDQIVCALERYHLVHGAYPKTLDELAPAFIAQLPHDIMNGEPYHYQLYPDGTFLLYSVGWNQTDDGGKIIKVTKSEGRDDVSIDMYSQGDWPWPTTKQ